MDSLTTEQLAICDCVERGHNVIVDAVAGSGKTRTILELVARNPSLQFCVLLYSASLKAETRRRLRDIDTADNAFVHSFHSAINHVNPPCHNDEHLLAFVAADDKESINFPRFDVLVVDESQDLTPLLLKVIFRICRSQPRKPQLVVLGDRYQCIYGYSGADVRYLTLAQPVLNRVAAATEWRHLTLSTTFRCPKSHVDFINHNVLQFHRLNVPPDAPVGSIAYHAMDAFTQMPKFVTDLVLRKIESGVDVTDIAILVAGVNIGPRHPVCKLVNQLSKRDIDLYIRNSNGFTSEDQMRNKLCILSFHQSKGLEFKHVILLGFDESYREFYDRGRTPAGSVPSTIYVALSRAKEDLTIVRYEPSAPFDFLRGTADTIEPKPASPLRPALSPPSYVKTVTDALRYMTVYAMNELMQFVTVTQCADELADESDRVYLADTVTTPRDLVEFVADLNGTVVHRLWQSDVPTHRIEQGIVDDFFRLALRDEAAITQQLYRVRQLEGATWVGSHAVQRLVRRVRETFDYDCGQIVYEAPTSLKTARQGVVLNGSADGYNVKSKHVLELTTGHGINLAKIVQTAMYVVSTVGITERNTHSTPKRGIILNACTGQILHVRVRNVAGFLDKLESVLSVEPTPETTDEEFLSKIIMPPSVRDTDG